MEPNVGGIDWWSRVVIGSFLIASGVIGFGQVWLVIGLFLFIIGVAGFADRRYVIGAGATAIGVVVLAGLIPFAVGSLSELFVSLFVIAFGVLAINTAATRRCPVNLGLGIQTLRSD